MNFKADDYLAHHGIKGQKWGIRRFQNSDGSLTSEGKKRYSTDTSTASSRSQTSASKRAKRILAGSAAVAAGLGAYAINRRSGGDQNSRRLPNVNLKEDSIRSHNASVKQAKKIMAKMAKQNGKGSSKFDRAFENTVKNGKDKPNISPAESVMKQAGHAIDMTKSGLEDANRLKNLSKPKQSYDDISDAELRRRINRIHMEREYESLTSQDRSEGYERAMSILTITGAVVGTVGAGIDIYTKIKHL